MKKLVQWIAHQKIELQYAQNVILVPVVISSFLIQLQSVFLRWTGIEIPLRVIFPCAALAFVILSKTLKLTGLQNAELGKVGDMMLGGNKEGGGRCRLHKIKEAWLSYNVLEAEITYALEEGGDTDVTRSQVNEAWNVVNDLIMSNKALDDNCGAKDATRQECGGE